MGQEETNLFNEVEAFLSEAERLYDEGRIWELRGLAESCESLPIMLPSVAILEQIADRVPGESTLLYWSFRLSARFLPTQYRKKRKRQECNIAITA